MLSSSAVALHSRSLQRLPVTSLNRRARSPELKLAPCRLLQLLLPSTALLLLLLLEEEEEEEEEEERKGALEGCAGPAPGAAGDTELERLLPLLPA